MTPILAVPNIKGVIMRILFYGGVNEIGGNKILVDDGGSKIFLDFGLSYSTYKRFYADFLAPRKCCGLNDYLEFGLIPNLPGLYRTDYTEKSGLKKHPLSYDAVFLSHAHFDHSMLITLLHEDLPIFSSLVTKKILCAIETAGQQVSGEFTRFCKAFQIGERLRGEGLRKIPRKQLETERPYQEMNKPVDINDMQITRLTVDHSIPGSSGYIIRTPQGNIAYTGDLRFHGASSRNSEEFIKRACEEPLKILITEGTNIDKPTLMSEKELSKTVSDKISSVKGLVLVNFPIRDFERLNTFYKAAKENGRRLVINLKQALTINYLEGLGLNIPPLKELGIYIPMKGWGLIDVHNASRELIEKDYYSWEKDFLFNENSLTYKDIKSDYSRYVLRCDYFELKNLTDIRPPEGSIYIRSITEPIDEEMELEDERTKNWLRHFNLFPYHQAHCSGHASGEDLKRLIEETDPEVVIPIHTERPHKFREYKSNVWMPTPNAAYSLR